MGSLSTFLSDANAAGPVVGGSIVLCLLVGLAVFVRIQKRWTDFRQTVERHGFTVAEKLPGFVDRWRTLATRSDGARTFEIREELVHRPENEDFFQELTLRLPKTGSLDFLIRPKSRWRKLEPVGETCFVPIGSADFDDHWLLETNQPQTMQAALTPPVCAHFCRLAQTSGIESFALRGGVVTLRDSHRFLPADRFEHAWELTLALAAVAEKSE